MELCESGRLEVRAAEKGAGFVPYGIREDRTQQAGRQRERGTHSKGY